MATLRPSLFQAASRKRRALRDPPLGLPLSRKPDGLGRHGVTGKGRLVSAAGRGTPVQQPPQPPAERTSGAVARAVQQRDLCVGHRGRRGLQCAHWSSLQKGDKAGDQGHAWFWAAGTPRFGVLLHRTITYSLSAPTQAAIRQTADNRTGCCSGATCGLCATKMPPTLNEHN